MRNKSLDILVVLAIAFIALMLSILDINIPVLRAFCGVALALILPGYALCTAIFPRSVLNRVEWLLLSVGLSLGLAVLGGLVLNLLPWGLNTTSWAILLGSITLVACVAAIWRRQTQVEYARFSFNAQLAPRQYGILALAGIVLAGAITVAVFGAQQPRTPGFTQLWIQNSPSTTQTVQLGIHNMESSTVTYTARIVVGGTVIREWPGLSITQGDSWMGTTGVPTQGDVIGLLYRADAPTTIYRQVLLRQGAPQS